MHVIFHAFSRLQYIYTRWHRRRLPRDAKRESSGCTRSTRGKFYDTGSGATRKSRREHSSELQPEHNALLEDMMRLFLVPPRYVFWTLCMLLVDSIKRILYLDIATMSSKQDRSMVVTTWKKLPRRLKREVEGNHFFLNDIFMKSITDKRWVNERIEY